MTPMPSGPRSVKSPRNHRSEERRVGKEWRYRCAWSSDVSSPDLLAVAAGRGRLGGQPHHEVDDPDAVRAPVGEVAEEPQPRGARGPVALGVDEALLLERGAALEIGR